MRSLSEAANELNEAEAPGEAKSCQTQEIQKATESIGNERAKDFVRRLLGKRSRQIIGLAEALVDRLFGWGCFRSRINTRTRYEG